MPEPTENLGELNLDNLSTSRIITESIQIAKKTIIKDTKISKETYAEKQIGILQLMKNYFNILLEVV